MLKALLGKMMKAHEDQLVCLFCLLFAFCILNYYFQVNINASGF